ncbi:MAG: His-Xaa-Ser system protein HxsD [Pseudomonadota bacterium]
MKKKTTGKPAKKQAKKAIKKPVRKATRKPAKKQAKKPDKKTAKKKTVQKAPRKQKPPAVIGKKPAFDMPDLDRVVVPVDETAYPLDAVYGAAYVFLDRAYVFLERGGKETINVSISSKLPMDRENLMAMAGEFVNELLNQAIRKNLDESTRKIREYIVVKSHYAPAESRMDIDGLLDRTLKEAFDEDPLDIAVPWEEKYGKDPEGGK